MTSDARILPVDSDSAARLSQKGLRYGPLDTADTAAFTAWMSAEARGFHEPRLSAPVVASNLTGLAHRRTTGVWDDTIPDPTVPVATVSSWITELTVPGPQPLDAWGVSSVTVAPTHRRRGIARAMMEAELRTAHAAGIPLAMLTATEATIYGRFGYAPATTVATIEIDRRRVSWKAPDATGRVQFVEPAELRDTAIELSARAATRTPGEIARWDGLIDRHFGLADPDTEAGRSTRTARYDDADGVTQGVVAFRVLEEDNIADLQIDLFCVATDDAYRGLWRFLLEHDLVRSIRSKLRSVDEPLPWLLADRRAVRFTDVSDHLWLRVLDPVASLEGRRYGAAGRIELDITDPLGFATGRFLLVAGDDGVGSVTPLEAATDATADTGVTPSLSLGVNQLGSIYLGGVRPSALAIAGAVEASSIEALALADRMFAAERPPHLSISF